MTDTSVSWLRSATTFVGSSSILSYVTPHHPLFIDKHVELVFKSKEGVQPSQLFDVREEHVRNLSILGDVLTACKKENGDEAGQVAGADQARSRADCKGPFELDEDSGTLAFIFSSRDYLTQTCFPGWRSFIATMKAIDRYKCHQSAPTSRRWLMVARSTNTPLPSRLCTLGRPDSTSNICTFGLCARLSFETKSGTFLIMSSDS